MSRMIDRRFARILGKGENPRLQVSSGTDDPKLYAELLVMVRQFAERQPDLIRELRDHHLTPLQAYHQLWLTGKWLRYTGRAAHARPLLTALESWAKKKRAKLSEATRQARLLFVERIRAIAKPTSTLAQLPTILERHRERCEDDDTASTFNHDRNYARAFLRDTVKKSDPLYLAVADLQPLKVTPKRGRHPQTPDGARVIAQRLGGAAGAIWLSLCYTGMNPKEFFRDGWEVDYQLGAVHIHGEKRAPRQRFIPLLAVPVVPTLTQAGFKSALQRAKIGVTPVDARRSYHMWLAGAKIQKAPRDYFAGHKFKDMEGLYTQPGESMPIIREWLADATPKLQVYCGLPKAGLEVSA